MEFRQVYFALQMSSFSLKVFCSLQNLRSSPQMVLDRSQGYFLVWYHDEKCFFPWLNNQTLLDITSWYRLIHDLSLIIELVYLWKQIYFTCDCQFLALSFLVLVPLPIPERILKQVTFPPTNRLFRFISHFNEYLFDHWVLILS